MGVCCVIKSLTPPIFSSISRFTWKTYHFMKATDTKMRTHTMTEINLDFDSAAA